MALLRVVGGGTFLFALCGAALAAEPVKDVRVVNAPVVMVGNAPAVTVENTPTVNVGNVPAVTVANTPTVSVDPAQLAAAVQGAEPGRRAFQVKASFVFPADSPSPQFFLYPPLGRRAVIEHVSAWVGLTTGETLGNVAVYTLLRPPGSAPGVVGYHYLPATPTGGSAWGMQYDGFVVAETVRLYHDTTIDPMPGGGTTANGLSIVVGRNGRGPGQVIATISGYTLDCVAESCGP